MFLSGKSLQPITGEEVNKYSLNLSFFTLDWTTMSCILSPGITNKLELQLPTVVTCSLAHINLTSFPLQNHFLTKSFAHKSLHQTQLCRNPKTIVKIRRLCVNILASPIKSFSILPTLYKMSFYLTSPSFFKIPSGIELNEKVFAKQRKSSTKW